VAPAKKELIRNYRDNRDSKIKYENKNSEYNGEGVQCSVQERTTIDAIDLPVDRVETRKREMQLKTENRCRNLLTMVVLQK
jgi:hypothetical protein